MTPEQQARSEIDKLLSKAGWLIQDGAHKHISVGPGVAIREFRLRGHGFADCLLYRSGVPLDLESAPETAKRGRISRQWSYEQTAGAAEKAVPRAA